MSMSDLVATFRVGMLVYPGDGSERCLKCGSRNPRESIYVGRPFVATDEGLPERYPACSLFHGQMVIKRLPPHVHELVWLALQYALGTR